jgi:hypothetical protein
MTTTNSDSPEITEAERDRAMLEHYNRVMAVLISKVQYLPEKHKADIRRALGAEYCKQENTDA